MYKKLWIMAIAITIGLSTHIISTAQENDGISAIERAGEIKAWREQCSDPDTDLRVAYLEAAIASGDRHIQRICVRQALQSESADVRNLGLRAAIASLNRITFQIDQPENLKKAVEKAEEDQRKLKEIYRWYVVRDYNKMQPTVTFEIKDAKVSSNRSTWYPLIATRQKSDSYSGSATITGSSLNWVGSANLLARECVLNVQLKTDSKLEGTLQCADYWPYPVSANLL